MAHLTQEPEDWRDHRHEAQVPHVARGLVGTAHGRLLPASALLGGTLMLGVDLLTRSVSAVALPPGVITALLGTPVFLLVLARLRTEVA